MADPHFIGLVHSVLSSAQAAIGEEHSPMAGRLERQGIRSRRTAERSLALLEMLEAKTRGNLDPTEKTTLTGAIRTLREGLEADEDPGVALPLHDPGAAN